MAGPPDDAPKFRYTAALANEIERRWQDRWAEEGTYHAPNPTGPLQAGWDELGQRPKLFVLDMFPYPSGTGLHVGHPLGYIGTDVLARFKRMTGHNVLHAMGYDAFGLPAEQYAVQTGQHPRVTTEANIANMRRQFRAMGLGHDDRRSVATTDVDYYRWTQWIFLQIFNSWYDAREHRARPISELPVPAHLQGDDRRRFVDDHRLAYIAEAPVNWCPALGTVLANEEVTADGRSERGNFPVYRRPLKQWMLRITAYADRLIEDLALVDWPEPVKLMQRNWIGRSEGARVTFPVEGTDAAIEVFTTRPDTLFGATFMVLAPEHTLVDELTTPEQRDAVAEYRRQASQRSDLDRQVESRDKTGVATGAYAVNPVNGERIPVWIADYVLMGYGTGAIMAVPAQDERDWAFAERFGLPIIRTVQPPDGWDEGTAFTGDGPAINSGFLDGLTLAAAKRSMIEWLEKQGAGQGTVTYKLRDWLFSRQRYWGEPFPIVFDDDGFAHAVPEHLLPVELPEIEDYAPEVRADDDNSVPEPPLGRVEEWKHVTLDLGDGPRQYRRELNTMPQWAGSCWYYLRYLDPANGERFVDPDVEHYWMQGSRPDGSPKAGGVDLYVGGVEHAVLHLLYSRFWHKVLYDLGHVSTPEPFQRLFNQGMVLAPAFTDERGVYVDAYSVEGDEGGFTYEGRPVTREFGKMGKSLKNSVSPDDIYAEYGADTLRLYEMAMGPLDAERPWNTRDIVGVYRFLQRLWRNVVDEETGTVTVSDAPAPDELRRLLHRTFAGVADDMEALRFNTAVAKLIELNNALGPVVRDTGAAPREVVEGIVLMLAPLAPHVAEELWSLLGGSDAGSVVWTPFPEPDPALLVDDEVEVPVQVGGKVKARIRVAADAEPATIEAAALADPAVQAALAGREPKRVVVVPGRMVNIVI